MINRKDVGLTDPYLGPIVWFPPPAVDVRGSYVAWAELPGEADTDFTTIFVLDVLRDRIADYSAPEGEGSNLQARIGSLKVAADGNAAWISCPDNAVYVIGRPAPNYGTQRPNCLRAGQSRDEVWMHAGAGGRLNLQLAAGSDIDPTSVRIHGRYVLWRQANVWRHARIPNESPW